MNVETSRKIENSNGLAEPVSANLKVVCDLIDGDRAQQTDLLGEEVRDRFGVLPNFFRLAPEAPEITTNLWGFARFSYLDNPLPSLFKERLFVYLSRFCSVRYCLARHVGFLVGSGDSRLSGDAQCSPQTIQQAVDLIRKPFPRGDDIKQHIALLERSSTSNGELLTCDSPEEESVLACAAHVFLHTAYAPRCLKALQTAFGEVQCQHLSVFLTFVRTAHYWTEVHPELGLEDDIKQLLAMDKALSECVLNESHARSSEVSQTLLDELDTLRQEHGHQQEGDRASEALRESEQRFREMIDALPVAIYTTDPEGRLTHFNRAAVELSGRVPELGTDHWCVTWKLYYPDGRPMPHGECPMAVSLRERRPVRDAEAIAERPDGTRFWFQPYPTPLFDGHGSLTGGVNMLLDITERKAAEAWIQSDAEALTKLNELSSRLWNMQNLREGLNEMLGATIDMLGADMGNIQLLDAKRGTLTIEAQRGFKQDFLDFFREVSNEDDSACGRALRTGERIIIEDVEADPAFAPLRPVARVAGYRAVQSTPLLGRDRRPLGMISTHFREVHRPSEQELRRLDLYARQASDFIERCRADEALHRAQTQLEAELADTRLLASISAELVHEENVEALYEKIMDAAVGIMRADFASLQMLSAERGQGGELRLLAFRGFDPETAKFWESVRTDSNCTCGVAMRTGKRAFATDVRNCEFMAGTVDQAAYVKAGLLAAQSTPLISRTGKVVGMISTHWKQPHEPTERDLRLLDVLARQAADLIDRKQVEQAQRESEERYRQLANLLPVAVYTCDATGLITYYNQQAANLWGRAPKPGDSDERFCGSEQMVLPNGQVLPHDQCPMALALRDGLSFRQEAVNIRRPDGSQISVLVNIDPVKDNTGRIAGAINVFSDVTDLRQAEAALAEREALLRAVTNEARVGLVMVGEDGRYLFANQTYADILGLPDGDIVGKRVRDALPTVYDQQIKSRLERALAGERLTYELRFPTHPRTGKVAFCEVTYEPRLDHRGRYVVVVIVDVTERKEAEELLRQSEVRFRMLADNMAQLAWTCDKLGNVTWYNQRWLDYTGLTFEDMKGWGWKQVQHPDHVSRVVERVQRSAETGEIWEDTFPLRGRDGSYRWFLSRAVPIHDEQGNVVHWFGTSTDIEDLKQAREAAETANRVKDEFLATVSHELRTPLNAIMGWTHLLTRGKLDEETSARGLETIARNASAQNQLISDLLDVSRIISGQLRYESGVVDLLPVIEAATETVRPAANTKGITLQLDLDQGAGLISGDGMRLQQIVWNLLSNAVKFTSRGGQVLVQLKRENTSVVVSVSDTGEGINAEFLPYIFDRFRQAESTTRRQHGGLGLGLAIVRHLVEAHGGTIRASSKGVGKGATFTVTFPLLAVHKNGLDTERADISSRSAASASSAILKGLRVLVIDDEEDARELLTIALTQSGAEVKTAATVRTALGILDQWKPNVLVSDIGMPVEDGYDLIRTVRALGSERGGTVPALALTGYASAEDAARARVAGYQIHMAKPVAPSDLVVAVAGLADERTVRTEATLA